MHEMLSESIFPVLYSQPEHYAEISGSPEYPQIEGMVLFFRFKKGTIVVADIAGLPGDGDGVYGFHIHEGFACTGNEEDAFADAGGHYNPYGKEHPLHAGDMPVLMGNDGRAWSAFYTERFMPGEVAGRAVVIHDMADDFKSQPSGNSGEKIACGIIV
ncbi:MAG: superoxide dismutase family protein [Lachnospiraceae bacterium]|nr:superoxide dismutase family protein [Lachnospiraceae bacterium]